MVHLGDDGATSCNACVLISNTAVFQSAVCPLHSFVTPQGPEVSEYHALGLLKAAKAFIVFHWQA